jgi:regulator of sigma E protease
LPDEYKVVRQYGPFNAIVEATDKTWQLMKLTVSMLGKLITGDVKLNNLSGPTDLLLKAWWRSSGTTGSARSSSILT